MSRKRLVSEILASLAFACLAHAADPVVSNVRASQRAGTKLVDIYYNVSDADGNQQTVSVVVSADGTPITASNFSGHVGSGVTPGSNKHIVWNAGADWTGQFSTNVRFTITADDGTTPPAPAGMVLIPGGSNSGTNPLGPGESYGTNWYPQTYSLTVASFYMDKFEVTKALWDEVKNWNGGNGYSYDNVGSGKGPNHPVQTVNWYDCVKWCNARSQKEGRTPVYYTDAAMTQIYKTGRVSEPYVKASANGYRLPTDAQWEYAARGGVASKRFPWGGNTISHAQANYYAENWSDYDLSSGGSHPAHATGGYPYTSPVGSFAANGYGLYDMAGNVWELCYDWYYEGWARVPRGGGWEIYAAGCRVGFRSDYYADGAFTYLGFRAVLPPGQ